MTSSTVVTLAGVHKTYEKQVLCELDLVVAAGEFVTIVGRSGSGKSTLLNIIAGLEPAEAGTVEVVGADLATLAEPILTRHRRRHVGMVFQSFNLIPTLTVAENLALPMALDGRRLHPEELERWLERVELGGMGQRFPETLSGGEQQRVAVARALTHGPSIILADEPTGNLDLETARRVVQLMRDCVRQAGATLIMATHSLATHDTSAADDTHRWLELHGGRLRPRPLP